MLNNIHYVGNYAFQECTNATCLELSTAVEKIGKGAFKSCGFSEIVPSGTAIIPGCGNIPGSVVEIGEMAFWYCKNLKSLIIRRR